MTTFWHRGADNLKNGTILGGLFGLAIVLGDSLYNFFQNNIPESWLYLGSLSIPVYVIVLFTIIGYFIDKH